LLSPWPFGGAAGQEIPGAFDVGSRKRRAVMPFKTPSRNLKGQAGPVFVSPRDRWDIHTVTCFSMCRTKPLFPNGVNDWSAQNAGAARSTWC
jgi:hypothetical protein